MSAPQKLAIPLAARIAVLPPAPDTETRETMNPSVASAAAQAMTDGHTHYTDRPGILPLRQHVVETLGAANGIEMSANEVTITCGAVEGRFVALKQLVGAGGKVLAASGDSLIAAPAALIGAGFTTQADEDGISLLYLTPADDPAQRDALLQRAAAHGWWVLWDMSVGSGSAFHPAQNPALVKKTITLGEVSELSGWRVGWMAGSEAANKLRAFKQSMTICTTSVSQWAALGLKGSQS
jgi:arginine:pyruvate transaminase